MPLVYDWHQARAIKKRGHRGTEASPKGRQSTLDPTEQFWSCPGCDATVPSEFDKCPECGYPAPWVLDSLEA